MPTPPKEKTVRKQLGTNPKVPIRHHKGFRKCVSFDLFETLVSRSVWPQQMVVMTLKDRLSQSMGSAFPANKFLKLRLQAERDAYHKEGARYTLESIYARIDLQSVTNEQLIAARKLESEIEIELAQPIQETVDFFNRLQDEGTRCIVISDTYLDRPTIRSIIAKIGIQLNDEDLFISCEHGVFKVKGRLFRSVLKTDAVPKPGTRHMGNSKGADRNGGIYAGLWPIHYQRGNCDALESTLWQCTEELSLSLSAMIAESRMTRLNNSHEDGSTYGARLLGCIALGYLAWICQRARASGIEHIFLLSRDAYLLHRIQEHPSFQRHLQGLSLSYLYGSRRVNPLEGENAATTAYLQQEGLLEGRAFAVVDVGWRGSYHAGLCQFRAAHGLSPIHGFFIGIENTDGLPGADSREALFALDDAPSRRPKRFDSSFIYFCESLFQAPHGGVSGYKEVDGEMAPVLDAAPAFAEQLKTRQSDALAFISRIVERDDFDLFDPTLVTATRSLILRTSMQPTRTEARIWGNQLCEPEDNEAPVPYPLAPGYGCVEFIQILFRRRGLNRFRRQWSRARIANSALPIRRAVERLDQWGR